MALAHKIKLAHKIRLRTMVFKLKKMYLDVSQ